MTVNLKHGGWMKSVTKKEINKEKSERYRESKIESVRENAVRDERDD